LEIFENACDVKCNDEYKKWLWEHHELEYDTYFNDYDYNTSSPKCTWWIG
jgi:hypothetical protein